jgi:hypothetical protein
MQNEFFELLKKKRQEAGFRTAYRFFYDNGGKGFFGCSYRQYLRIELGNSIPGPERLSRLVSGLRMRNKTASANELALAWLKSFVGDEVYVNVFSFLGIPASAKKTLPTANAHSGNKRYLTPIQMAAALTDKETYLCFLATASDNGVWTAHEIAEELSIPFAAAERALTALHGVKLLKRVGKGRYRSAIANHMIELPPREALSAALMQKHRNYTREIVASGREEFGRSGIIRADDVVFRDLFPVLQLSLDAMMSHKATQRTKNSALYYITGRVVRLRDF